MLIKSKKRANKHSSLLYRFTTHGEGVFSAGKRLLPPALLSEVIEAKSWLPKPSLPRRTYRFYLTKKGKEKYEKTLLISHKKYLPDIRCKTILRSALKSIVYEDEWQVVDKVD